MVKQFKNLNMLKPLLSYSWFFVKIPPKIIYNQQKKKNLLQPAVNWVWFYITEYLKVKIKISTWMYVVHLFVTSKGYIAFIIVNYVHHLKQFSQ